MSFDLPPATRALIIANVAVFLLQQLIGDPLTVYFALWPWGHTYVLNTPDGMMAISFHIWQLVTYGFMHGGFTHILFNMFALWMFGGPIERLLGKREFLIYYFTCIILAALCHELVMQFFFAGTFVPTLGASGGVFGLLLAFGMFYPHERIMLIIPPIPMPAWVFVTGYGVLELFLGVTGTQSGVAHFAHLGGMLGGFVLIEYWRGKFPFKPKRRLMR